MSKLSCKLTSTVSLCCDVSIHPLLDYVVVYSLKTPNTMSTEYELTSSTAAEHHAVPRPHRVSCKLIIASQRAIHSEGPPGGTAFVPSAACAAAHDSSPQPSSSGVGTKSSMFVPVVPHDRQLSWNVTIHTTRPVVAMRQPTEERRIPGGWVGERSSAQAVEQSQSAARHMHKRTPSHTTDLQYCTSPSTPPRPGLPHRCLR